MHMPSAARAQAVGPSQELLEEGDRIHAVHEQRRRAAMVQSESVTLAKLAHDAGGDSFLTQAEMHLARDLSVSPQLCHELFEEPASEHPPVEIPEIRAHRACHPMGPADSGQAPDQRGSLTPSRNRDKHMGYSTMRGTIGKKPVRKMPIGKAPLLPPCMGVYLFSDRHGNILYVGKARDLRRRVAQHIREGLLKVSEYPTRTRRKRTLMAATHAVAWLPADTEVEALLLEESLIKTHRPAYNRRQNKFTRQAYLEVSSDGTTHTVRITDHPETCGSYGPFSDKFYAQRVVAILDEQFGISPPYGGGLRAAVPRPAAAERFLLGYDDGLIHSLQEETRRLASNLQFERAATVRDQLSFCERFLRRQAFVRSFTFGALIVSEVQSPGQSEHHLFHRGRLVDHASCGVPETWESSADRIDLVSPEPQWLLFERALVVYAWLNTGSSRKSVQILRGD